MIVYTINKYFILYKWKPLVFLAYRKKVELDFTFFNAIELIKYVYIS